MSTVACKQCGLIVNQCQGYINRALREGKPLYCNRTCAGLARRRKVQLTEAEKKAAKAAYDKQYRADRLAEIKAKKAAWFQRHYAENPEHYRAIRERKMAAHVEYCRKPEYKVKKSAYDRRYRASEYGPFAEAFLLLQEVQREVDQRMTDTMAFQLGLTNKSQHRKRALK